MRIPHTVTPLYKEYWIIGHVLFIYFGNAIYNITKQEFVDAAMDISNGAFNPKRAEQIYIDLMNDAGLTVLEEKE